MDVSSISVRLSLAATTLALVSIVLLMASAGARAFWLVACAPALLATHARPERLAPDSFLPLLTRLVAFPLIFVFGGSPSLNLDWFFDPRTMYAVGQVATVELVLQHWKHRPTPQSGRYPIASVLLSSLVFLAGANVSAFRGEYVTSLAPLFILLLGWALLDWRAWPSPSAFDEGASPTARSSFPGASTWTLRTAVLWGLVVVGGWGLHSVAMHFKDELMSLGSGLLLRTPLPQVAGISNQPRLGSSFQTPDAPKRVLRIEGELDDPHLRAASFDLYENGSWLPGLATRRSVGLTLADMKADARGRRARVTRLVDVSNSLLFAPLNAAGLRPGPGASVDVTVIDSERESGMLRSDEPSPFSYDVIQSGPLVAGVPVHQGPLAATITDQTRAKYLQLPPDLDPRVRRLADEATLEADDPASRVAALVTHLMANHPYSETIVLGAGDPVTQFLLEKKGAHCEFFAASMVLLARSVGVPARYAVGYLAHEPALGEAGVTIVRQRDAHAWAEVWIDGVGWVTADATPAAGRPEAREEASWLQRATEAAQDFVVRVRQWAGSIPPRTWALVVGLPLLLWAVVRGRPLRSAREQGDERAYASPDARLNALAARFESWLAREKLALPASRSWSSSLHRLGRPDAAGWAHAYETARFGSPLPQELQALEATLEQLENPVAQP
jgi:transglutaminase-like putative cysteine protease